MATRKKARLIGLAAISLIPIFLITHAATAGSITDPANDFIPSFTGTPDPSLDVLSFSTSLPGRPPFAQRGEKIGPDFKKINRGVPPACGCAGPIHRRIYGTIRVMGAPAPSLAT